MTKHAKTENVDQRIALEAFVEVNFAADGRDADAIAVVRDARDYASEKPAIGSYPLIGGETPSSRRKGSRRLDRVSPHHLPI